MDPTEWKIIFSNKAGRQTQRLEIEKPKIFDLITALSKQMAKSGPIAKNWPSFGPLKKGPGITDKSFHCHLKNGRPTYVACWRIEDETIKLIEVFYVGTHENAPY